MTEARAGGEAQVVEYLPSKHEALSSNPGTTKKLLKKKMSEVSDRRERERERERWGWGL
jgi:hypothetical protein